MTGDAGRAFGLAHIVGLLQREAQAHGQPPMDRNERAAAMLRPYLRGLAEGIHETALIRLDVLRDVIDVLEGRR